MKKKIISSILCFALLFAFTVSVTNPDNGIQTYGIFEEEAFN